MASSSIPSSRLASGRTPTPELAKSKRYAPSKSCRTDEIRRPGSRFAIREAQWDRFTFSLGRFEIPLFGRVNGAWWPARSSKPLSIRQLLDRGRFDSYPLRLFRGTGRTWKPESQKEFQLDRASIGFWFSGFQIQSLIRRKEVTTQCRANRSAS